MGSLALPGWVEGLLPWWMPSWAVLLPAIPILALLVFGSKLRKRRFHDETAAEEEELAPASVFRRHVQPWLGRLAFMGYREPAVWRIGNPDQGEKLVWRMVNRERGSMAVLKGRIVPDKKHPEFTLTLFTQLGGGQWLVTAEPADVEDAPPDWLLLRTRFKEVGQQCEEHDRRLQELEVTGPAVMPFDPVGALREQERRVIEAAVERGALAPVKGRDGVYRFGVRRLPMRVLHQLGALFVGSGWSRTRKDLSSPKPAGKDEDELDLRDATVDELAERDVRRYRSMMGGGQTLAPIAKAFVLLGSLWLSMRVFGGDDPVATVGVFLGVLVLHEFGHWLPMKLFGYRNLSMIFLPGFGAATSGRKLHAPAWQELVVLLGGPLPGMLGGLGVLAYGYFHPEISDFWLNAASIAVVVNAFNLLPFMPLDGGRILDLLIFRDLPTLRLLFTGGSALTVFLGSFLTGIRGLRYVGIVMFMGLIMDFKTLRHVKMAKKVHWRGQATDEDKALHRIFREIRQNGEESFIGSGDWHRRTEAILHEVMRRPAGWFMRLFGGATYLVACFIPVAAILAVGLILIGGGLTKVAGGVNRLTKFSEQAPVVERPLADESRRKLDELALRTVPVPEGSAEDAVVPVSERDWTQRAQELPDDVYAAVDQLDWAAVGAWKFSQIETPAAVWIWLESARLKMDQSMRVGRAPETIRRAEVVMHALSHLAPATSFEERRLLQSAEASVLRTVADLNGRGWLSEAERSRLSTRIEAFRRPAKAENEAYLLVEGWTTKEFSDYCAELLQQEVADSEPADEDDAGTIRKVYAQVGEMVEGAAIAFGENMTTAIAREWIDRGSAGVLPQEMVTKGSEKEAAFVRDFVRDGVRLEWMRVAVLSAMRLEDYRVKSGHLPDKWGHELRGGGRLELRRGDVAELVALESGDAECEWERDWLPDREENPAFAFVCPLLAGGVETASKDPQ